MPEINIRKATAQDMPAIHSLIVELAIYEKEPDAVEVTVEQLTEDGFGKKPVFEAIVAEGDGEVVGFALYYTSYSTWKGRCLYLEDFLVSEAFRGKGIGALLFERLIAIAKETGANRMDWQVLDWNEPALNFYRKYNALLDPEWTNGRFSREELQQF